MLAGSVNSLRSYITYKWETLWIPGTGLNEELVAPAVESFEAFRVVDVVYKHTAICASIECNTERLESFLAGSIPELEKEATHQYALKIPIHEVCFSG